MSDEISLLKKIPYEETTMTVHQENDVMPKSPKDWASVNYLVGDSKYPFPTASI